jgi:alpha-L-rhamnosidase
MQNEGNTAACGWFSRSLAGIRPSFDGPGFKQFIVEPQLPPDLDHAEYRYRSPYGNIISGWRKEGNVARFMIEIPPNTTATVSIPGQQVFEGKKEGPGSIKDAEGVQFIRAEEGRLVFEVQSGRYHFTSALQAVKDDLIEK